MDFWELKQPCIPGMNFTWSWRIIIFNMFLHWVCYYFVENYYIHIHRVVAL